MPQTRLANIDALRGAAAFAVFLQHALMNIDHGSSSGPVWTFAHTTLNTIDLGRLGVVVFFLISGFVVPFSIKPDRPVVRFAVSRVFRLYPAFWVSLLLAGLVMAAAGRPPGLMQALANASMAATVLGEDWMVGVYWTLFIEMLFYGLVAALFVTVMLYRPLVIAGCAVLLALTTLVPIAVPGSPLPVQYIGLHLSVLFCGLLLRLGLVEGKRSALVLAALVVALQMVGAFIAAGYALETEHGFAAYSVSGTMLAYGLGFIAFVTVAVLVPPSTRALAHLAAVSYSVYLLHEVVNAALMQVLPPTGGWLDLVGVGISLALTLALAQLVHALVERPGMALGRHLLRAKPAELATA
jgi:Predicted acyltransferases